MSNTSCQATSAPRTPVVNDIWRDISVDYDRLVWVEQIRGAAIQILSVKRVEMRDHSRWVRNGKAGKRWTKIARFNGPDPDFEFVEVGV